MSQVLDEVTIDDFVSRLERRTEEYLRKNLVQRFSIGHPSEFIMPIFRYCLHAVREVLKNSNVKPTLQDFLTQLQFCIHDMTNVIARTLSKIVDEYAPHLYEELQKLRKAQLA